MTSLYFIFINCADHFPVVGIDRVGSYCGATSSRSSKLFRQHQQKSFRADGYFILDQGLALTLMQTLLAQTHICQLLPCEPTLQQTAASKSSFNKRPLLYIVFNFSRDLSTQSLAASTNALWLFYLELPRWSSSNPRSLCVISCPHPSLNAPGGASKEHKSVQTPTKHNRQ